MHQVKTGLPFGLTGSKILIAIFLILSAYVVLNGNWYKTRYPLQMDANGYYIYLPAVFIYEDLGELQFVESMPEQFDRKYFLYRNARGGYLDKYAPGLAILQLPFFLVSHLVCKVAGFPASGYSPPYRLAIALSTLFYTLMAFLILRKLLLKYFSDSLVTVSLLFLGLGTNIFFYAVLQAGLVHNYLLFLFSIMLWCLDAWWKTGHWKYFAFSGAAVGLMTLIRPTELLTALIPAGFFLYRWHQGKPDAIPALLRSFSSALLLFLLCLLPLLLYWKLSTGNWIAYTYEQEGFYFDRPSQIWLGLFGFRKGWFIYTPMAALAVAGLFLMYREEKFRPFLIALSLYFPLNLFIVLSWYCWWYGGCFGQRAFIPALAIFAFPFCLFLQKLYAGRRMLLLIPLLFVLLNLFQSFQYQRQVLHMDAMTWPAYKYIFGKWKLNDEEKAHFKSLLDPPDYSQRGKKLNEYFR